MSAGGAFCVWTGGPLSPLPFFSRWQEGAMSLPSLARRLSLDAFGLALLALPAAAQEEKRAAEPAPKLRFSGPYTQDNLTIFLIHGADRIQAKNILTLDEALEKKVVVVHETDNVNQLSVENVSEDHEVFLQACDIVKGGKQDRILAHDLLLPPKSGKVAIPACCSESGRSTKRGAEEERTFGSSKNQAATNDVKLAARKEMSQRLVWDNVGKAQATLGEKAGGDVKAAQSASSLQLSLE